jgi:hypothetical protein
VTITCSGSNPNKATTEGAFATYVELLDLFPNPAADRVVIRLSAPATTDYAVTVYDYTGKQMLSKVISKGDRQLSVDLTEGKLASGIYMVSVQMQEGVQTRQLVLFRE